MKRGNSEMSDTETDSDDVSSSSDRRILSPVFPVARPAPVMNHFRNHFGLETVVQSVSMNGVSSTQDHAITGPTSADVGDRTSILVNLPPGLDIHRVSCPYRRLCQTIMRDAVMHARLTLNYINALVQEGHLGAAQSINLQMSRLNRPDGALVSGPVREFLESERRPMGNSNEGDRCSCLTAQVQLQENDISSSDSGSEYASLQTEQESFVSSSCEECRDPMHFSDSDSN